MLEDLSKRTGVLRENEELVARLKQLTQAKEQAEARAQGAEQQASALGPVSRTARARRQLQAWTERCIVPLHRPPASCAGGGAHQAR